jgi:hypothetical protein
MDGRIDNTLAGVFVFCEHDALYNMYMPHPLAASLTLIKCIEKKKCRTKKTQRNILYLLVPPPASRAHTPQRAV